MRERLITTAAIFLAILGFATVQMRAEIPIVQADTVFQGFGGGSVSGIVFSKEGSCIILNRVPQPAEIDIMTHQIIKEFEKVPNYTGGGGSFFGDDTKKIVGASINSSDLFGIKDFSGEVIWDAISGKIIQAIPNILLQKNGGNYYSYLRKSSKEYLGRFDINTFKFIDSIYLPKDIPGIGSAEWGAVGIIPNSNKVLVGVKRYIENTLYPAELYVLDFDTKKYTKIPIPYDAGYTSSSINQIVVSNSGKFKIIEVKLSGANTAFFFYDQDNNFIYKMDNKDFINITDIQQITTNTIITAIEDDYLLFCLYNNNISKYRMAFYNIQNRNVSKYLGFLGSGVYDETSQKIGLYGTILGLTGIFDLYALPVKDISQIISPDLVYSNNQLEYRSDIAFIGESQIFDTTGKLIANLGLQPFIIGKNIIRINQPLMKGVYILTIKNGTEQSSYKFIVE
ncbi:MAG: T9SS type A sorting domain-containing protein [bacterium]